MGDPRVSIQKLKISIQIYNTCLDTNNKTLCLCSPCSRMCCPGLHSCSLFMCAHPALVPTLLLFALLFDAIYTDFCCCLCCLCPCSCAPALHSCSRSCCCLHCHSMPFMLGYGMGFRNLYRLWVWV